MERQDLPLKYLWTAAFEDGHIISQPADDRYSKHDDTAEWNPSAFRDVQEYSESPLSAFALSFVGKPNDGFSVFLRNGLFFIDADFMSKFFKLEKPGEDIINRKLIYYRTRTANMVTGEQKIESYTFGYQGFNKTTGKTVEKTITIS